MQKLKQTIESTLINNLECHTVGFDEFPVIEMESIQTCSDYISQEIRDIAINFAYFVTTDDAKRESHFQSRDTLFNQFIEDRYKEQ